MNDILVFISHIHEEAELAQILKEDILRDVLGIKEERVFISSDIKSAKSDWFEAVNNALMTCKVFLLLAIQFLCQDHG